MLLGSGDAGLEAGFRAAARTYPGKVGVEIGYDEALSHLIIGGSDSILVPSRFEPCGLTQLYALRYGSPPVVRRTGGLADTVVDATEATLADGTATGFAFDDETPEALLGAVRRAVALYARPGRLAAADAAGHDKRFQLDRLGAAVPGALSRAGSGDRISGQALPIARRARGRLRSKTRRTNRHVMIKAL